MRSNSAREPWISTWTLSSWPIGKNSRLWSVVNATMSPAVGALGSPFAASVPASQYTNAGVIEKIVPMIMKNQRPTMAWRIWSRASSRFNALNLATERSCAPNVLPSSIPETDSVSSVTALISARRFCVSLLTNRRTLPTRAVSTRKNGSIPSDSRVRRQSMNTIATIVLRATATLEVTELAVSVTTRWTPPTSFDRRLWISPVRVAVKNRSGIRCRWAYSAFRRSCITLWPMRLLR